MEAAVNIKDAGKTRFSPLEFLKEYLFRVELMEHNGQLTTKVYSLEGDHCQGHKLSAAVLYSQLTQPADELPSFQHSQGLSLLL